MESQSVRLTGTPIDLVAEFSLTRGDSYEFTNTSPGAVVALAEKVSMPERDEEGHTVLLYGDRIQFEIDSNRNIYAWSRDRYHTASLSVFSVT